MVIYILVAPLSLNLPKCVKTREPKDKHCVSWCTFIYMTLCPLTVVVEMYSLMGMVAEVTAEVGPFSSKDFSSGVNSFLERLIIHLS